MFTEEYPTVLKAVSWEFNDQVGILAKWNGYCKTTKDNPYFTKNELTRYIETHYLKEREILLPPIEFLIDYITETFSVKYIADAQEFKIYPKKVKAENGKFKAKFDRGRFEALCKTAMISTKDGEKFLKDCLSHLQNFYNKILLKANKKC